VAVLVTGGAGFIGSHVIDRLAARGRDVVCLDDFNDFYDPEVKRHNLRWALESGRLRLIEGDICDQALCARVFEEEKIDEVIHLAARAGVRPSIQAPLLYEHVNARGTVGLLELAVRHEVRKFVFGSTSSIYGVNQKIPFSEDDPITCPISPYACSKRAAELFCYTYHHLYALPVVCLRFFTVYGPRQRPDLAIHKFARLMLDDQPIPVFGDGTSRRDYTYFSDIVDGIMAALDRPLDFEIINLGDSNPVELNRLIELLENALGRKARIDRQPVQPGDVPVTYADISKARRLLAYEPRFPIEEGIRIFARWLREIRGEEPHP
jgi:UDP-glucuronate 4-epimerase